MPIHNIVHKYTRFSSILHSSTLLNCNEIEDDKIVTTEKNNFL